MRLYEEYETRVNSLEKERESIKSQFKIREVTYIEKIKLLESRLADDSKEDMVLLQKQNREYEATLNNLGKYLNQINTEHETEKKNFNSIVLEVIELKKKLIDEIKSLESLKKEIYTYESPNNLNTEIVLNEEIKKDQRETTKNIMTRKIIQREKSSEKKEVSPDRSYEPIIKGNKITVKVRSNV
jgi:hypothetical protein